MTLFCETISKLAYPSLVNMVSFQILSDTHLECSVRSLKDMIEVNAEILCLLGDIGSPLQSSYAYFLKECSDSYKHVLVISGNHEYYNTACVDMACIDRGISSLCSQLPNVHYLNNSIFDIDGIRFIGTTLWTHMPEDTKYKIASLFNDYNYIYCEERIRLHPDYTNHLHKKAIQFIDVAVGEGVCKGLKNVVLTHHTPSFRFCNPKHDDSLYKFGLSTEMASALNGEYIKYWACGHTHLNLPDTDINGTILICNQYGRRQESLKNFSATKRYVLS